MNPEDAANLTLDSEGRPLVTLLRDPDGAGAFLSVVQRGANGRRISVAKAGPALPGDGNPPVNQVGAFLGGDGPRASGLWARLFAPLLTLFGGSGGVEKGEPTTFNSAIQAPKLSELLWQATDALRETIRNILADDEIADKGAAHAAAVDQFRAYLLAELAKVPVAKAAEVASLLPSPVAVEKAGKMLSSRNATQVRAARDALSALLAAAGVDDAGEVSDQVAKEATVLDVAQLSQAAEAAGRSALAVAKTANPGLTPQQLVEVGTAATASVYKAAVQGPPQPALPSGELARQIAEAANGSGSPANPTDAFTQAIAGLKSDVMKGVAELKAQVAKLDADVNGTGEGEAHTPGLRDVVAKSLDVVAKLRATPAAPRGAPGPGRVAVAKTGADADEPDYTGTALSLPA